MRKWIMGILIFLMIAAYPACAEGPVRTVLMIYMTGSSLESGTRGGAGSADIAEMIAAMPPVHFSKVVLLTGGASAWVRPDIPSDENVLWEVTSKGLIRLASARAENMGDPETLAGFLKDAAARYPADRYALILWDHGAGPNAGICQDEHPGADSLSLSELTAALEESPFSDQRLMFLGFDACFMATAEVACAVAPYARYMIASQEPEPSDGWDYSFLPAMDTAFDGAEVGKIVTEKYYSFHGKKDSLTLSCVDLDQAPVLEEAMDRIFAEPAMVPSVSAYRQMAFVRTNVKTLGNGSVGSLDLVDLGDFLDEIEAAGICDASEARNVLDRMVICGKDPDNFISGLSIYCPFENKSGYTHPWGSVYRQLDFSDSYKAWVDDISHIWLGSPISSWKEDRPLRVRTETGKILVSADISEEEETDLTGARLLVLEETAKEDYRLIWSSEDTMPGEGNVNAVYAGEALYALDRNEQILAGPITWRGLEDDLAVGAIIQTPQSGPEPVYLICQQQQNGEFTVSCVDTYDENMGMFFPSAMYLLPGDELTFVSWSRKIPETGVTYEEWPYGTVTAVETVRVPENGFILKMLPMNSMIRCHAVFELRDSQANIHLTQAVPLDGPSRIDLLDSGICLEEQKISLTLTGLDLIRGTEGGLKASMRAVNTSDKAISMELTAVALDQTVPADLYSKVRHDLEPKAGTGWEIMIPEKLLRDACIRSAETLFLEMKITGPDEPAAFVRFSFPIRVNFAVLSIPDPSDIPPLAETANEDATGQILRIGIDPEGTFTGLMRIENLSENTLNIRSAEVWLNETEVYGSCCAGPLPMRIPEGKTAICSFRIFPYDLISGKHDGLPDDISGLDQLTWVLRGDKSIRLTWTFNRGN